MTSLDAAEILQKLKDSNLRAKLMPESWAEQGEIYQACHHDIGMPPFPMPTDEFYVMREDKIIFIGSKAGLYTFVANYQK